MLRYPVVWKHSGPETFFLVWIEESWDFSWEVGIEQSVKSGIQKLTTISKIGKGDCSITVFLSCHRRVLERT